MCFIVVYCVIFLLFKWCVQRYYAGIYYCLYRYLIVVFFLQYVNPSWSWCGFILQSCLLFYASFHSDHSVWLTLSPLFLSTSFHFPHLFLFFVLLHSLCLTGLPLSSERQPFPAGEFLWQRAAGVAVQRVALWWRTLRLPAVHWSSSGSLRRHHCSGWVHHHTLITCPHMYNRCSSASL